MNKTEEELSGVKGLTEFRDIALQKLEYIGQKQDQIDRLMVWAKRAEQVESRKTLEEQIKQEIEKVGKIASNGHTQIQKGADKIEKAFETLGAKIGTHVDIQIKVKVEGVQIQQTALGQTSSFITLKAEEFEAFKAKVSEDKPDFAVSITFMLISCRK